MVPAPSDHDSLPHPPRLSRPVKFQCFPSLNLFDTPIAFPVYSYQPQLGVLRTMLNLLGYSRVSAYTGRWDGWEMPSWKAVSGK